MKVIKFLLFGFNIVFFVMGFAMAVAGGVVLGQLGGNAFTAFFEGSLNYVGAITIVVGVFVMVLAFFGCCGAFMENKCMVKTYATLMIILVIIQIAVVIVASALRGQISKLIEDKVDKTMEEYNPAVSKKANSDAITLAWDTMQQELKCCGLNVAEDWMDNHNYYNTTNVPDTCCIVVQRECGKGALGSNTIFSSGCKQALEDWLINNLIVGVGFGVSIFLLQIVGIVFACCLARQIGNYKEV
jgi:CD63 antigen